jgi:ribonuclease BN (tRNA processing enzyme)
MNKVSVKDKNYIKFLGTAGARFVVTKQIRNSGGIWFNLDGIDVLVDPGPGTLVRCHLSKPKLNPMNLKAIILTHRHIDHSSDVNIMIEAMTEGGFSKKGTLYTTEESLNEDPVVLKYVRNYLDKIEILKENLSYFLSDNVSFSASIKLMHTAETYGIKFKVNNLTISHIADTSYFDELPENFSNSEILIINVVRLKDEDDRKKGILHLTLDDAKKLIRAIKPKYAILTHFGMKVIKAKPWEITDEMTSELGINVIAASDGMKFDINSFV